MTQTVKATHETPAPDLRPAVEGVLGALAESSDVATTLVAVKMVLDHDLEDPAATKQVLRKAIGAIGEEYLAMTGKAHLIRETIGETLAKEKAEDGKHKK